MFRTLAFALALGGTSALAQAPEPGTLVGHSLADVSAALEAEGYSLSDILKRQSVLRVTALRDGERHEFRIAMNSGKVLSHKVLPLRTTASSVAPRPVRTHPPAVAPDSQEVSLKDMLAREGYDLLRSEREGGTIEAYARRDGRVWELHIDAASGRILNADVED
ncbi:PepSY domain-containing protein [Tropicimonas isoalkanivorans]|uniref:Peptidase propeptide and YPEB domain-containing protein n=1 Tax=Tropicimonas isoalkanivorans TaxID=441112 RepID=A0A1I1NWR7_9RHOB|nr:PepSY domain-containing protein [Tropicimonas isoalkanivorans]SFD02131.1 Peptidase propeptide and YPEB domain-containing protein [Tropicimonas isoalkanivorans]